MFESEWSWSINCVMFKLKFSFVRRTSLISLKSRKIFTLNVQFWRVVVNSDLSATSFFSLWFKTWPQNFTFACCIGMIVGCIGRYQDHTAQSFFFNFSKNFLPFENNCSPAVRRHVVFFAANSFRINWKYHSIEVINDFNMDFSKPEELFRHKIASPKLSKRKTDSFRFQFSFKRMEYKKNFKILIYRMLWIRGIRWIWKRISGISTVFQKFKISCRLAKKNEINKHSTHIQWVISQTR